MRNMLSLAALVGAVACAQASVIIAPVSGVINTNGPGFGTLTETINQAGLNSNYINGVTNFNAYIATNPTHTLIFNGFEWFSNQGTTGATVTYDLGSIRGIDRLALWNEESSGIGRLDLQSSTDGITFTNFATGLLPTDNPFADYGADVFSFNAINTRYVRFIMTNSPQPNPGSFQAAAIGEVAFRLAVVPEPVSLLVFGGLVVGGGLVARKRLMKKAVV